MNLPTNLDALSPDELRTLAAQLMAQVGEKDRELRYRQAKIDQLTHEPGHPQALEVRQAQRATDI